MGKRINVAPGDCVVIAGEIRVFNRGKSWARLEVEAPQSVVIGEVLRPVEQAESWDRDEGSAA